MPFAARLVPLLVVLGLALAPVAHAQDSGVAVDPDSPGGQEYAIPAAPAQSPTTGGSSGNESGATPSAKRPVPEAEARSATPRSGVARPASEAGGTGDTLAIVAIVVGILAGGGLVGLAIRRLRGDDALPTASADY